MKKTRVLLTMEHEQLAELLKKSLAACSEIELVGEATGVIHCMKLIASERPHIWIHGWEDGPAVAAVLSHIYQFHPSLSVIRINPDEPAGYLQMQINSMAELLRLASQTRQLLESA